MRRKRIRKVHTVDQRESIPPYMPVKPNMVWKDKSKYDRKVKHKGRGNHNESNT